MLSSKYSPASSLRCNLISVPRPSGSFHVSSEMANAPSAFDSQTYLKAKKFCHFVRKIIPNRTGVRPKKILNEIETLTARKDYLLFVIIVFANDFNVVSNKINRVETNSKLTNEIEISTCLHFLNECCRKYNCSNQFLCETNSETFIIPFHISYLHYIPDVPDFAIVPKFLIKSSLVIPIPLSRIERIFFSLSNLICNSIGHSQ